MPPESCHEPGVAAASPPRRLRVQSSRAAFVALWLALTGMLVAASAIAYVSIAPPPSVSLPLGATVYYNEACSDCEVYLQDDLLPALRTNGLDPVRVKDYINDRAFRAELTALNDALGIPFTLQSHLTTFVRTSRTVILEGHVPSSLIAQALDPSVSGTPNWLLVYQDSMDTISSYRAWDFAGSPQEYPITEPIATYYAWIAADQEGDLGSGPVLPIVLITGLLDGLNPCAFAVLLFFVAFLYAARAPRPDVLRVGSLYIYAVFLVYLLIGLGILGAILLSNDPHLMAKLGAILVIVLGGLTLASLAFPSIPLFARMPSRVWGRVRGLLVRGSLPSAAAAGALVGLCTFPCSGGIYVAILGFLASQTAFLEGLGYLYLYNFMFILPLVITMAVVSDRRVALRAAKWEREHARAFKAAMAASLIVVGVAIFVLAL